MKKKNKIKKVQNAKKEKNTQKVQNTKTVQNAKKVQNTQNVPVKTVPPKLTVDNPHDKGYKRIFSIKKNFL